MLNKKLIALLLAAPGAFTATSWIAPGAVWYDTDNKKIDAHGGGVVQVGDTYYWSGQSASNNETPMMYSSTDLINWKNLGRQAASVSGLWRPKIARPNNSFWLYGQQDRYVLSLRSTQLVGNYSTSSKVHLPPSDYTYSDTGMFFDEASSTWYILTSADHNTVQINKINADGSIGARASALTGGAYEAPGLFTSNGTYFLIVSGKTGWRSNPNKVFTAPSIAGPWTGGSNIAPEAEKTYNSQNTFELVVKGSQTTTYIYMGDSWDSNGGPSSNYIWLPMAVDAGKKSVTLQYHAMWKVDVETGLVTFPTTAMRYDAQHQTLSSHGKISPRQPLTSSTATRICPGSSATFHNVLGTGSRQWMAFNYTVSNPEAGQAHIFVNDQAYPTNLSELNSRAGRYNMVPVQLVLKEGHSNKIRFGAVGSEDFEIALDGLHTYEE